MQIVPFPAYYQSVYTNFDFTSFSLISCKPKGRLLEAKRACIQNYDVKNYNRIISC